MRPRLRVLLSLFRQTHISLGCDQDLERKYVVVNGDVDSCSSAGVACCGLRKHSDSPERNPLYKLVSKDLGIALLNTVTDLLKVWLRWIMVSAYPYFPRVSDIDPNV